MQENSDTVKGAAADARRKPQAAKESSMGPRYSPKDIEERVARFWDDKQVYKFDSSSKLPVYSIDTPPPTISGNLHLGHVFSYSQADFVARYKRMRGYNVFYPFGFDNNGLPTEILVEKTRNIIAEQVGREKFNEIVKSEAEKYGQEYRGLWSRVGISVDWSLLYTTMSERVQKASQLSFIELYRMGRAYRKNAPTIWCTHCKTSLSQMELEDSISKSKLVSIRFADDIVVATTRPELLPSCVAIFVNPGDKKNSNLIGKKAKVPIFGQEVEVLGDRRVDPGKGTGIVMCCTFGDLTDIDWYKEYNLPLKISIDDNGKMLAAGFEGLRVKEARERMIEELRRLGYIVDVKELEHSVNVHERCKTEIEFLVKEQWYIRYLDLREEFLKLGGELHWHPEYMKVRYDNWVKGLRWDWGISRQRYYGVPFPVWYCKNCGEPSLADEKDLPVNPLSSSPSGKCGKCGSGEFIPESDVMDTWATSSLTPLINAGWTGSLEYDKAIYPLSLRPQGHDIITFWLFTSIVKGYLHTSKLPFSDVMISGHGLDSKGRSMHKSLGNVVDPLPVVEKYGADALRAWASLGGLGNDVSFQEKDVVSGMRLANKLWNVARFIDSNCDAVQDKPSNVIDRWIISRLMLVVKEATQDMEAYDYSSARRKIDKFFWFFADNYIEFVKHRLYSRQDRSAESTLRLCLLNMLKLYAPYMPYITEEIYSIMYTEGGAVTIHKSAWPEYDEGLLDKKSLEVGDLVQKIAAEVRHWKHENGLPLNCELSEIVLSEIPEGSDAELMGITNAKRISLGGSAAEIPETAIKIDIKK